ncbi:MAG: replication initiator protein A, partial [Rhodospirillaceae bacterium]|nr:replication initiator protein A [Rhodospirillaceae bacterium]
SISLKDVQQQMEFPFFSLSKRPDHSFLRYSDRHGNSLEVVPSGLGLPTIYDKDILIYAISQIMDRLNRGEAASRHLIIYAADVLEFANRTKSGRDYKSLESAFLRLRGCTIKTNIRTGDEVETRVFGLIEEGGFIRKYGIDGRLQHVELVLSRWLWQAIEARQVLTLHPDYFRLRQPLERRLYEIARKHCGAQAEWKISLRLLREKCAAKSQLKLFRHRLRKLIEKGELLDYVMIYDGDQDVMIFHRQEGSLVDLIPGAGGRSEIELPEAVAAEARRRFGPAIDLAAAERDWRRWMGRRGLRPTNPPALFLSFLATWADRRQAEASEGDDAPDWIGGMATEWWETLDEAERQALRRQVGERIELDDGEGWYRSEASIARDAFDRRWRRQHCPPGEMELPPQLLARAARAAGADADPAAVEAGWREWIVGQPSWMQDMPMMSVMSYAERLAGEGRHTSG